MYALIQRGTSLLASAAAGVEFLESGIPAQTVRSPKCREEKTHTAPLGGEKSEQTIREDSPVNAFLF